MLEVALTLFVSALLVRYLRPFLRRILTDLCGTEDRAQFWLAFSNILLIGIPVLFALSYSPQATNAEELFFEMAGKLSGNLASFLFALIGIGFVVSFFALFVPRADRAEAK
jgi:hypothetical protein